MHELHGMNRVKCTDAVLNDAALTRFPAAWNSALVLAGQWVL